MKSILKASTILALLSPFVALAIPPPPQTGNIPPAQTGNITALIKAIGGWVGKLAVILIGVALVVFFWGIIRYVLAGADEEKRAAGRSLMIYGVIGLFVMVAIWGLVYFLASLLGVETTGNIVTPGVPVPL
jgi:hypothetical protein